MRMLWLCVVRGALPKVGQPRVAGSEPRGILRTPPRLSPASNMAAAATAAATSKSALRKLCIDAVPLTGRRVLCRVDFNTPMKDVRNI